MTLHLKSNWHALVGLAVLLASLAVPSRAAAQAQQVPVSSERRGVSIVKFLGGAGIGLATHEAGHLLFDALSDADPGVRKVDFHGIPFFAITHDSGLPRHQEFVIVGGVLGAARGE